MPTIVFVIYHTIELQFGFNLVWISNTMSNIMFESVYLVCIIYETIILYTSLICYDRAENQIFAIYNILAYHISSVNHSHTF